MNEKNVSGVSKDTEKIVCVVIFVMMGISLFAFLFGMLWLDSCLPKKVWARKRARRVRWPSDPAAGTRQRMHNAVHRSKAYEIPSIPLRELERCVRRND